LTGYTSVFGDALPFNFNHLPSKSFNVVTVGWSPELLRSVAQPAGVAPSFISEKSSKNTTDLSAFFFNAVCDNVAAGASSLFFETEFEAPSGSYGVVTFSFPKK